ncbi:MAG: hypothetical protein V7641_5447 [Blastocatellia bacterium]
MEQKHRNTARQPLCSFFSEARCFLRQQGQPATGRLRCAFLFSLLACLPIAVPGRSEATHWPVALQEKQPPQPDKPADARDLPKTATPSPYLIESLLDINEEIDLKRIWHMLNIAPPTGESYRCEGNCEAEIFDLVIGDKDHKKTIALRISHENSHFYQYLVFKQRGSDAPQKGAWELLGKVDCFDQRGAPPSHRIEQGDGRIWLVIKEMWKHGMGMAAYGEVWYEIQESALKRVLSYPAKGHDPACQRQPRRAYQSIPLRHDLENGTYTIPIQFLIAYEIGVCDRQDAGLALFSKGAKAYYVWIAENGRFVLDETRSGVTEQQLARLADAQGFSDEAFVEDNFQELARIAANGDAQRKSWLKNFLTRIQSTARKIDLQRLLK